MKAILFAGFLLLFAVLICGCTTTSQATGGAANATPDLLGNWSGSSTGYIGGTGFTDFAGEAMTMRVAEQKDRIFGGEIVHTNKTGSTVLIDFAGAIGRDGRTLTIVEEDSGQAGGYSFGTLITPDEIELIYADDARPIEVAIDSLKRS